MDHMRRHTMKLKSVKVLVLDEADEMLDMGFREDIETILQGMPEERQTALFSATMPKPILDITKKYQNDAEFIKMTPREITVAAIEQAYYRVPQKMKEEVLTRLMDYYNPARSLIFCNTKRMVDQLAESLKGKGYLCDGLHGDLSQNQRDTVMNLFRSGRINILIATDVAARGIDVSGVEAVFNYDIPEDIEYYVHRIGRTGRAGKSGKSFTLVGGREMYKLREIEKICHTKIEERHVPNAKEITRVKSSKVFAEVVDIIENGDISSVLEYINQKVEEGEYTAEQLAAGFMKLKMGSDIEELVLFEKKESKRDRYRRTGERLERRRRDEGRSRDDDRKPRRKREDDRKPGRKRDDDRKPERKKSDNVRAENRRADKRKADSRKSDAKKADNRRSDIGDLDELKALYKKSSEKAPANKPERSYKKKSSDSFENVGRINIKGEGSTKAWYVGQDKDIDTMNLTKKEKKNVKAQNKKRSLDYLQDMSDLVMESFGKRKNREKK
jgi:ATP-dependent RNA helicase DeaD